MISCNIKCRRINKTLYFAASKYFIYIFLITFKIDVTIITLDNFTCGKCHRVFTTVLYLARHIKRVCPDMSQRKWKCDRCDKAFRHPFGLNQHIYTHTGERPHKCEQCSKAFYSANDLRRHVRTHSGKFFLY